MKPSGSILAILAAIFSSSESVGDHLSNDFGGSNGSNSPFLYIIIKNY